MSKPFIQIDDEVREMTDDEHAAYLEMIANTPKLPHESEPADDASEPT